MDIFSPTYSRRRILRLLGQGALALALPSPLWAEDSDAVTISILHTTDLHGHILPTTDYSGHGNLGGLARCATQLRKWRGENPHSITLDIGDVYQGTELGLRTRGATMIRCLDALGYDSWVVGNHEFDWGLGAFTDAVGASSMPVLSGNAMIDGKVAGKIDASAGPLAKLRPWIVKEVAGFRIAIIGLTTPALLSWLPPEDLRGFEVLDPLAALRATLRAVAGEKPDAIVLAGHMGLKRRDDYANRVAALTAQFPQLTVYIGGHTHQNQPSEMVNNVLYTQADHFGIFAGRVDLIFDRATRKLRRRSALTVPMDHQIALDPLVLSTAQADIDAADKVMAQPIGELTELLGVRSSFGQPSEVERLIASAMKASLQKRGVEVDAIVHGLFDEKTPLAVGPKTIADAWALLPYENEIVTVELSRADLFALARDLGSGPETRNIMGLRVIASKAASGFSVDDLRATDGAPLPEKPRYRVAMNSYDSQSAGQRFVTLARLVAQPSNRRMLHPVQTRDALVDFFVTRQKVGRRDLLV